ncbi:MULTISPECIES: multidrug transporter [unclassified Bacillus (in: firmicutes)]|nr:MULTISPECIES: multidrug transporter [unclassified Bacillus (in: firmicutes)]
MIVVEGAKTPGASAERRDPADASSGEEAQRRPAEREAPGTKINSLI